LVWVKTVGFRWVRGEVKPEARLWVRESKGGGPDVFAVVEPPQRPPKVEETALAA
jgi:hypothetical protein